jgi:phage shock protein A
MAVFDQYVREVEDNLDSLEDAVATVGGELKTLRRKESDLDRQAAELDRNIDLFLREGKEDLAMAAQSKLNSVTRLVQNYDEMLQRQEAEFQSLKDARLKLEAKLTTVKQEREELQALLDLARSKELTAKTIKSLDSLAGSGDADIARVADGIRERLDKASARSEMLASSLDMQMDEVLEKGTLEAQLAERKARLGLSE